MTHPKIAFIKANWHSDIVDQAQAGFEKNWGEPVDAFKVPGAFEMPLLAKRIAETGNYGAIVAAALIVDGGIYRHEFVAAAVVDGLMRVQLDSNVPVFSVSLTPHHFHNIEDHISFFTDHFYKKGIEASEAVKQILEVK